MRGRRPQPNEVKRRNGSDDRYIKKEPDLPLPDDLRPPRGLLNPEARKFWLQYAPILAEAGILKATDIPTWTMTCIHYAVAVDAYKQIMTAGLQADSGAKNPLLQILRDNSKAFLQYAGLFGLNPSDRGRMGLTEEEDDEFERLLAGPYNS